jgi:hypothetical protein
MKPLIFTRDLPGWAAIDAEAKADNRQYEKDVEQLGASLQARHTARKGQLVETLRGLGHITPDMLAAGGHIDIDNGVVFWCDRKSHVPPAQHFTDLSHVIAAVRTPEEAGQAVADFVRQHGMPGHVKAGTDTPPAGTDGKPVH